VSDALIQETVSTTERRVSTGEDRLALSGLATLLLCLCGVAFALCLLGTLLFSTTGMRDFMSFRVGAQLLGTPHLYDMPSILAVQKAMIGSVHPGVPYARPPFFAAAIRPLLLVSYSTAACIWKWLLIAALVASASLFPFVPRRYAALAVCCSLPATIALEIGSDAPPVLLFVVLSLACWEKGRSVLAGVMLGLCLAKFHFLVFLPLLLFQRKYRRVFCGFAITASALLIVNFAVQPDWIPLYWKALNMPQGNMSFFAEGMPDFYGIFFRTGHPEIAVIFGASLVGMLLWRIRLLPFELAMPLCITGGLVAAPHTGWNDLVIAIPAFLLVAHRFPGLRHMAFLLLSPIAVLPVMHIGPPYLGAALFVAASIWLMHRLSRSCHVITKISGCAMAVPDPMDSAIITAAVLTPLMLASAGLFVDVASSIIMEPSVFLPE